MDVSTICGLLPKVTYDVCMGNVGGIQKVWIEDTRKIQPAYVEATNTFAGVFTTNRQLITSIVPSNTRNPLVWIELPTIPGGANMRGDYQRNEKGYWFNMQMNLTAPKNDNIKHFVLTQLWRYPLLFLCKDNNGQYWLGGYEQGLQIMSGSQDFGTYPSGGNGFSFTASGRQSKGWLQLSQAAIDALVFCEDCLCNGYVGQPGSLYDLAQWQWCLLDLLKNNDLS